MNRAQRRAQAKKRGHGRYTPRQTTPRPPMAKVEYFDEAGNLVKTEMVEGRPSGPPPAGTDDAELAETRERLRRRASAAALGLWLPGQTV